MYICESHFDRSGTTAACALLEEKTGTQYPAVGHFVTVGYFCRSYVGVKLRRFAGAIGTQELQCHYAYCGPRR